MSVLDSIKQAAELTTLPMPVLQAMERRLSWLSTARPSQLPPNGQDWDIWLFQAGRGAGKCAYVETPIVTPTGWTTLGELKAGDQVFDETGTSCIVRKAHPVLLGQECYRVVFSDGSEITTDGDQLWMTHNRRYRKAVKRRVEYKHKRTYRPQYDQRHHPTVLTTNQIAATLYDGKDVNHAIPVAEALQLPWVDLPVDPYVLGYWLGNGTTLAPEITGMDSCVFERFEAAGYIPTCERRPEGSKSWSAYYGANTGGLPFKQQLLALGVLGNKHIPSTYLRSSIEQRTALLQGLMDSDGYCAIGGQVEFCSTLSTLAYEFMELVRSLGFKPYMVLGRASLYGKDCGNSFRVQFTPYTSVFRVARKLDRQKMAGRQAMRQSRRYIVAVEPTPSVPVCCITVDSPSHLYLIGEAMIPTHNTRSAAEWLWWEAWNDQNSYNHVVVRRSEDLEKVAFGGPSGLNSVIPNELIRHQTRSPHVIELINGSKILGFSATEPDVLRGPQSHRTWCLIGATIVTMADGSGKRLDAIKPGDIVQTRTGPRKVLAAGPSDNPSQRVRVDCGEARLIGTIDHPVLSINRGWVPLGELVAGDRLQMENRGIVRAWTKVRSTAVSWVSRYPIRSLFPVFNLTVEGEHEFYANGILTHNCDELASWKRLDLTWDDGVLMSNRLRSIRNAGRPKIVISTTPRPLRLLKDMRAQSRIPGSGTYLTTGSTYENRSHLSSMAVDNLERRFKGTRREKQELLGMIVDDIPGALWSLDTIADKRVWDEPRTIARKCRELVVGVDPAASNTEHSDETGIVVAGRADDGRAFVLADRSGVYSPADWGREVVNLYDEFDADRVVVEVNNGGDMAIEVVTNAAKTLARDGIRPTPYIEIKRVHASRGKMTRAEPISARYAQGFVSHVGEFVDLEDQMVGFTLDRPKGGSPDRVDALVWALSALLLKEAPNLAESDIESFVKLSSWTIT